MPPRSWGNLTILRHRVPAAPDQLTTVRHTLTAWVRDTGAPPATVDAVALAVYEAMANVAAHAYNGQPGVLDLHATATLTTITVTVTDYGRWRPPPTSPGPLHGRGISLIHGLSHQATITATANGTTVRMTWPRQPNPHPRQSGP